MHTLHRHAMAHVLREASHAPGMQSSLGCGRFMASTYNYSFARSTGMRASCNIVAHLSRGSVHCPACAHGGDLSTAEHSSQRQRTRSFRRRCIVAFRKLCHCQDKAVSVRTGCDSLMCVAAWDTQLQSVSCSCQRIMFLSAYSGTWG